MTFFHLSNDAEHVRRSQSGHKLLHKLGKVYTDVIKKFSSVYRPHQQLSLDEGMAPWRGHLSFRVYSPDKPKYGIKAYMICDATNGYCLKFRLYTGKSELPVSTNGATHDLNLNMICDATNGYLLKFRLYTGKSELPVSTNGATYDLALDMMKGYYGRGHILYMNNYYNSPQFRWDLWEAGVGHQGHSEPTGKVSQPW